MRRYNTVTMLTGQGKRINIVNMEQTMITAFGQRLKAARVMENLSMDGLVERLGQKKSKMAISKYENGLMMPDSETLLAMAKALRVSPDYFFATSHISIEGINFRKKASLGKKVVDSIKERVRDNIERYLELEELLGIAGSFENPLQDMQIKSSVEVEIAARRLRDAWELGPSAPVPSVVDLLEENGIKVIELDDIEGFDGLSGWANHTPFIVLKSSSPSDRKRLTALHELSHLCLLPDEQTDAKSTEKLCHSFGAAFLLPIDQLRKELGKCRSEVSYIELKSIKEQYGISMQAIMYRAKANGIISEHLYERFTKDLSFRGWRKNEPGDYPGKEIPIRFTQLLHRAISEEAISLSKAASLSRKSISVLERESVLEIENSHP